MQWRPPPILSADGDPACQQLKEPRPPHRLEIPRSAKSQKRSLCEEPEDRRRLWLVGDPKLLRRRNLFRLKQKGLSLPPSYKPRRSLKPNSRTGCLPLRGFSFSFRQ